MYCVSQFLNRFFELSISLVITVYQTLFLKLSKKKITMILATQMDNRKPDTTAGLNKYFNSVKFKKREILKKFVQNT